MKRKWLRFGADQWPCVETLNFYVPPAYDAKGEELARGCR
jgi:hypothetical protein